MTLTGKRADIAAALSSAPGVTGHPYRPSTPATGDAWPLLGPGTRDAGTAFRVAWVVRVFMPQDERAAEEWWDTHWPHLFEALEHNVGNVQGFVPTLLAKDQLAYDITMIAEE
jgi:hypothetical protein